MQPLVINLRKEYEDVISLRNKYVQQAKKLGYRKSNDKDYINLKKNMHREYCIKANTFNKVNLYGMALSIYEELERTVLECKKITGSKHINRGLALHNQGVILFLKEKNYDRGLSLIQLAILEDEKLKHHGSAKDFLETCINTTCIETNKLLCYDQNFNFINPLNIVQKKLKRDEKYRLAGIMFAYQNRLQEMKSLSVRENAEINLMKICKLAETYIRRKLSLSQNLPRKRTLNPLIIKAFNNHPSIKSKSGYDWYSEWNINWLNKNKTKYEESKDDKKIKEGLNWRGDNVAKAFKLLTLIRNFTTHIYNEKSILFEKYDECFTHCVKALVYMIRYI